MADEEKDETQTLDEEELRGDERRALLQEQSNGLANPDVASERERTGNVRQPEEEQPADDDEDE